MKKKLLTVLSLSFALAFSACSNSADTTAETTAEVTKDAALPAETLTGEAQGYGGLVTVNVTREGDAIIAVDIIAPEETDGIGTQAVEELPAQIVAANGVDGVDVISGATITSEAIFAAFNNAINGITPINRDEEAAAFAVPLFTNDPVGEIGAGLRIGQMEYAAHGSNSVAIATVVLEGETVIAAYLDEYQFMAAETTAAVPGSDDSLGEKYADPEKVLGSKRLNSDTYSANMAERGDSAVAIDANFEYIEEYAVGKTVSELEELIYNSSPEAVVDAVSGATLADTGGYIKTIIEAARVAAFNDPAEYSKDLSALRFGRIEAAVHGTNSFALASALVDGDTIILSYVDEYQPMSGDVVGLPNTDAGFGEGFIPGIALVSKRYNDAVYSANMTEKAESTVTIGANYDSIQAYANGKSISEILEVVQGDPEACVDAVSGATLVDTANYLAAIIAAAEAAK